MLLIYAVSIQLFIIFAVHSFYILKSFLQRHAKTVALPDTLFLVFGSWFWEQERVFLWSPGWPQTLNLPSLASRAGIAAMGHTHLALCLSVASVSRVLDLHWGRHCLSIFYTSTVFTSPTLTSLQLLPSHPLLKLLTSSCYCYIFPRICVYKDNLPNSLSAAPMQDWSLGIG